MAPPNGKRLHFGCGPKHYEGYVNIDWNIHDGADFVWDMTKFPYPWDDSSIDEIRCEHTLEHFETPMYHTILNEFYRILKNGGRCNLVVPYFRSSRAYSNGHKQWFQYSSFLKITDKKNSERYNKFYPHKIHWDFKLEKLELHPTIPVLGLIWPQKLRLYVSLVFGEIVDEIRVSMVAIK